MMIENKSTEHLSRNKYFDETYNIENRLVHLISANVSLACQVTGNDNFNETKTIYLTINSINQRKRRRKSLGEVPSSVQLPDTEQRCITNQSSQNFIENIVYSLPGEELESYACTSFTNHVGTNGSEPNPDNEYEIQSYQDIYSLPLKCENPVETFHISEVCSMTPFMDGHVMVRWLGTLQTREASERVFIVTRSKDGITKSSWETFVKKVVDLPDFPQMLKTRGICHRHNDMLLLQEFMTCQTLFDYLSLPSKLGGVKPPQESTMQIYKLLNFTLQVCLGTEFLMRHGFSIPAFSTKKILLTKEQICKLHDFCSTEDALNIVERILTQPGKSIFSHPVECVASNKYTKGSDMWYAGTTIWEIFSGGFSPFDQVGKNEFKRYSLESLQKPPYCPVPIYNCIISCYSDDHYNRPNIKKLRFVLEKTVKNYPG
ncbi:Ephrin type-A receptor 1 [Holothuria leucospilota]|uniref:Ephrin type-A receptor 1 n=1 Tax=Holothuria leucospilota TaxID=206669 RepID=A0A9Q1CCQ8_HOLLE|nr:Ephrin type-A receptor 1 [Holothuria leucospilota]